MLGVNLTQPVAILGAKKRVRCESYTEGRYSEGLLIVSVVSCESKYLPYRYWVVSEMERIDLHQIYPKMVIIVNYTAF
jgi:hypothetical protein